MTDQIIEAINMLAEGTRSGGIKWEKTSKPNEYISYTNNYAFIISETSEPKQQYSLTMLGETGKEIFHIISYSKNEEDFQSLERLFTAIDSNNEENQKLFLTVLQNMANQSK